MSTGRARTGWRERPLVAAVVSWMLLLLPSTVGVAVALLAASTLPPPSATLPGPAWLLLVLGSAVAAWAGVLWGTRHLAPLPFLLRLTLVFPDDTPSRWKVARQAVQASPLAARVRNGELLTDDSLPPTAGGVLALVSALEAHDSFTRGHAERVRLYVTLIAEELDVPPDERAKLSWAALLHDIGKLKVPAETLNSTDKLTDEQWQSLRAHPRLGRRLCAPIAPWLDEWIGAVGDHHERWDGGGYPRGVAGEEISLAGRITAVADTFEVMTAGRPYSPPKPPDEARTELVACAGSQFDPEVVRAALQLSLGRSARLRALVASLVPLPLLRLAEYSTPRAWQSATLATSLTTVAVTGVLAAPMPPDPSPPDQPLAVEAPPEPDVADEQAPARRETQPETDRTPAVDATPRPGPTADPAGGDPTPPSDPGPTPAPPSPSPTARPPSSQPPPAEPVAVASNEDAATTVLHLAPARAADHAAHRVLPLVATAPPTEQPVDGDTDRGDSPGISLDEDRPSQRWGARMVADGLWAGPVELEVFVARPDFTSGPVSVRATLATCTADGDCEEIATSILSGRSDGTWTALGGALVLPPELATTSADARVEVRLSRVGSHGPVWVAPASTSTPSRVAGVQLQATTTGVITTRHQSATQTMGDPA